MSGDLKGYGKLRAALSSPFTLYDSRRQRRLKRLGLRTADRVFEYLWKVGGL